MVYLSVCRWILASPRAVILSRAYSYPQDEARMARGWQVLAQSDRPSHTQGHLHMGIHGSSVHTTRVPIRGGMAGCQST